MRGAETKGAPHADGHAVSVVIPTLNRATLARTLEALKRQTRPADELVVVEDKDRRGSSWARNEGIRQVKGDLVAFTDDDCVPPPGWLAGLVGAVDRYGADGAGGTLEETDPLLADIQGRLRIPPAEAIDETGWVGDTGNVMCRRALLQETALRDGFVFDERFPTAHDAELFWRLRRRGAKLVFVPGRVRHLRVAPPWNHIVHRYHRGRGTGMLYLAHRDVGATHEAVKCLVSGGGARSWLRWAAAIWRKGVGPFDAGSFRSRYLFLVYWVGVKAEGLGFIRAVLQHRRTFDAGRNSAGGRATR